METLTNDLLLNLFIKIGHPKLQTRGSGCGAVGKVIASDTRDLRFKLSHQQILFTSSCIEKTKIKKKEAGKSPVKKGYKHSRIASPFIKK